MTPTSIRSTAQLYRRAFREAGAYRKHLFLVLLSGLVSIPLALLMPLPVKLVVDHALGDHPLPGWAADRLDLAGVGADELLLLSLGLGLGLALVAALHHYVDWMLRDRVAERMVLDFRKRLLARSLLLPAGAHERGSRDPFHRLQHDAPALQWTALYGVIPLVVAGASLLGVLAVTAQLHPVLASVALVTALPVIGLIHVSQTRLRQDWAAAKEDEAAAFSIADEALSGARIVNIFGQQARETDRFAGAARTAYTSRQRVIRKEGVLTVLLGFSAALGSVAALYLGGRAVQDGTLTLGELLVVLGYLAQLMAPLQTIGTHVTGQQRALVSAERAFALLDTPTAIQERPFAKPLARAKGAISLRSLSFAYPGRPDALTDISLDIRAGSRVGIIGRTGAGKSTLVNLVMRQLDPTSGSILLDGTDLRDIRLADLHRQFAVVPQDTQLFSTTIAENIAYGRPDATMADIAAAAKLASADHFIEKLPDGYRTKVGERGAKLSGGERQRIAIARAFLVDAPILILDEPTSAIDAATEQDILASLERLMAGRTTLVIAHRLATLRMADLVLRVEGGTVTIDNSFLPELRLAG